MALEIKGLFNPTSVSIPTSHLAEIMDGGEEPTDSFTVTKNLSHCAISNEQIGEASYYAEIAPTGGWSDLQVTIKVGGVDMSEYYSSGVINIPNVTGNIVITATAAAAPLVSIAATYTQSGTVYDTDNLDSLRADLVVTANYDNGTSAVVTNYTLSGTLTEGTSTITVSYGGKTTTFNVVVTTAILYPLPDKVTETSDYKLTTTRDGHVEFEALRSWNVPSGGQGVAINLLTGACGATNQVNVNNQPKTFTFPANASVEWGVENVINVLNTDFTGNFRIANSSTSVSGTNLGSYITGDKTVNATIASATDIYYPFFYVNTGQTVSAGIKLSFDMFVDVNGVRYI